MRDPFYFRPPDYRYWLRSDMAYGWWTGAIRGNQQFLRSVGAAVTFNLAGELLQVEGLEGYPIPKEWRDDPKGSDRVRPTWADELDFQECPIRIKRFWLPKQHLGVEDMPDILAEYFTNRAAFLAHKDVRAEDAEGWKTTGQFVFHCGCGDYYMDQRGEAVTS